MKEYYLEQIATTEKQVAFARVGYMQNVNRLADKLKSASEEETDKIIDELVAGKDAYNELKRTLDWNQDYYRKEVEKEISNNG